MNRLIDSFWRAVAYCLRPGVMLLSLLPLVLMVAASLALGYFFWDAALDQVRALLDASALMTKGWEWLDRIGLGQLKTVLAPLIVIFTVTPLIVALCLLLVALLMTPRLVRLVAQRRFPALQRRGDASLWRSLAWSLASTLGALVVMVLTVPLWFVPPLILVLPPLIWGWLTYRVMAYDALAEHASTEERHIIFRRHRVALLVMGVVSGFLGATPSLVWASGALFAAAFVILMPAAIWIYTQVFAFASLWFAHYCLAALADLRREPVVVDAAATTAEPAPEPEPLSLESS